MNGLLLRGLLGGLVGLLVVGGLYLIGHRAGVDSCRADLAEHLVRAGEQARQIALEDAAVAAEFERVREVIRERTREIEVEVVKHVPPDCRLCALSPAGLGLLNGALSNHEPADDPGQPAAPVPPAAEPPRW